MAANSPSTTPFSGGVSSTLTTRQAARPLSLLDLDESVFNYVCAFVPLNDLLRNLAAASHAMWRRVSVSNSLWQQLWMRYLLHFCNSLIPQATTETLEAAEAVAAAPCMPDTDAHVTTAPRLRRNSSSAWYLYHFHHSAETKPRVVRLEELCLVHKDIVDPRAATPPTPHRRLNEPKTAELHLQFLRFAQRYATQTVARNVTHTTVPYSPLFASLPLSDQQEGAVQGGTLAQSKQQQRQAHRLQRVLHFLLSESGRRPQLYDRLWGATNEAKMEFIRRTCTAGPTPTATHDRNATPSTAAKAAKQQNPATPFPSHGMIAPRTPPVRLRPMSWLDDEETSVKVLIFSEDMRSVGDAAAVHEERSKLLASIAANWRIAYASNFYPCETDGNDPVIPLQLPASSLSPASATVAAVAGRGAASRVLGAERGSHQPQPTLHRGQSSWEQVYRRFRDDRSAVNRPIARPQQHAATQREDLTSDDDAVVPSSSNPLFDLHILGYEKRKQLYGALLASTVEVPDGMGMFFATCVSESFLRWLCWRNRRHTEAKEFSVGMPNDADGDDRGGPPMRHRIALAPFTAGRNAMSPPGSLWVVQVAAGDPRDYVEKSEKRKHSVTYSSSYSDVTTTMTDTSNSALFSASIDFTEEGGEDNSSDTADNLSVQETSHTVDADEGPHVMAAEASHPSPSPPALLHHAPVAMLFPLPHMLAYWFMMHHVSFYCHQVYRRMWGDQELTIAVSSRIISPTGHSVECRLFHSLRCPTIPCMFIKMMFTPGVLPSLTMQRKIADYSPYDSSSSSSSSSTDSQSSADADGPGSSPCKLASDVTDHRPVDARQVYDLFWTGFGRVEVECGPTISRSNLVRLRIALGLPVDFPMGLLWNVVMFASGIGPLILKEHRLSLHFNHAKTFTDVLADEFGAFACYGFGAQLPGRASNATPMANPIGAAVPVVVQGPLAQTANSGDLSTLEADVQADSGSDSVDYAPIGTLITSSMSSLMSLYSEMSSLEGYRSHTQPFSRALYALYTFYVSTRAQTRTSSCTALQQVPRRVRVYEMRASLTPHSLHRLLPTPIAPLHPSVASLQHVQAVLDTPLTVPVLHTPAREFRPAYTSARRTNESSSDAHGVCDHDSVIDVVEVRPIRTMQDLHTMLLGFAHAAATSVTSSRASLPHKPPSKVRSSLSSSSAAAAAAPERHGEVVLHSSLLRNPSSQPSTVITTPRVSRPNSFAAPNSEHHFLHRLLLHRRERRRRERQTVGENSISSSGTPSTATRVATPTSTTTRGALWYRAFELFSEAVQQHHVSPTAQHLNLLLYIAQRHALWGQVDDVEEFWARLLSSVQRLQQEKMRDKRRVEQMESKYGEEVKKHGMAPLPETLSTTAALAHAQAAFTIPPFSKATSISSTTRAALMRQLDELGEMEQALMPNAQTYELLLGSALVRGAWSRALEYCDMRTRSGLSTMTDASVRQVLQVYILAEASGAVTHSCTSFMVGSPPNLLLHRLETGERGQGLRGLAAHAQSSKTTTARSGSAQDPSWLAALQFFRNSVHRVSSMHTVWSMATLLNCASQWAELVRVVRDDCKQLVQTSLRSLAAHALTSVERAALLRTLKMVSDAACDLGDWCTALQVLREVAELRRQLLPEHSAWLEQLWGLPHRSGESDVTSPAVAVGNSSSDSPSLLLTQPIMEYFASPDQMNTGIINDDILLDEVRLSQHLLKNALLTLRRVRRYAQMIELYGATSGVPGVAVDRSAGTERAAEQDDSTLVWRSMWTPSAVGYVAQAALAVQDLDLLLGLCGLTADGETVVTEGARASLGIPAEVYDATLHLIQYHIIRLRCEAKKSMRNSSTAATAAAKGRGGLHWDVLSQRVYMTYRQRALRALAEEASPYRAYLEKTISEGDGHTVVVRNANVLAALAELDAPLLSSTHKPLVQLLAQSLQGGVDAPPVNATLQQQMLEHLQRIRCPDTLVIALAMDIVRTQARQRRFSDREAQTLLEGIQQVLNTVLVEQHMEPIQLVSTSPGDSVTRWVVGSGSAQRRQSSGHHRRLSGPDSLAASSPGGANWVSELTPTHLLSLSTLTAAAAHMSLDALACVQPLTLLTYIPACVELAWLPSTAAPAQLQRAQQAVVQRADEELQKDAIVLTEHHPTTTDQITRSNGAVLGSVGGTADLPHTAVDASPFSIEAHGKSAVAHFVSLYTEFSSRKTNAVAASSHAVLDAAAQVLMQLQRSRACHPPTAAMSAFIEALRYAWSEKTSLVHGPPPRVTSLMLNAEVEQVVVASLNAVVQQVGASTVSRWTMWGDCVDMLMTYIGPPFSAKRRQEAPTERTEATPETLRVLHMFIRLCDRAETDFVERVTMDWLLHKAATTRSSRTGGGGGGGGGCAQGEHIAHSASKHSETAVDTVEQLRSLCLKAQEQFRCASSVPHEPFSSQEWESMQLLIGALVWACRRQAKSLVRRLYSTLVPWLDVALRGAALPSSPSPANCIQSVTVNAVPGVAEKAVLHQQLSSLCETALAACTTVAQCLSSGPRVEVLQDWPLQLRALRQLTDQGNSAAPLSHFSNRRKLAALVDSIAAVVVKLRRTWCYLLNEVALDSHRLVSEAHQRGGASPTSPPLQPPASVLKRRRNIEDSAASFAEWSCAELLPRLVLSCLRACVEHEALSDTTPTTTPPTRGHFPSPHALVTAALHKILEAVWDVDFAAFVWQVKFRVREGTDDDGMRAQKLARLRARGYHALSIELAWLNGDSASQELVRHLYMWILFTLHSVSTTVAVTELCRDLVSLDAFHGIQLSSTTQRPFLLLFVQEVDILTEAKVTEALASAYCTGSTVGARAAAPASDASSSHVAALARMKDGRTAMEHLTNPLVHFTLSTLRAAQQAAQWVLYLILCEGTVDLQAAGNTTDAAQKPMGGDCVAMSHAAIPCARLLHRCLAWSGQTHVYPALLRVVEVAAHETLRGPEAVVSVFHHMERLGRAEERVDEAAKDGETIPDTSLRLSGTRPLDAFLAFYMHSTTMRRASPVSEQVCLAAVLACAAHTRTADAAAWLPPADLLTLLTAFPHVVSNHLITNWMQNRLSQHQTAVLTEWMLRFFWGGVVASSMDSSTACLKRYGVGAAAAADGDITTTTTVTLPLRRASMQWLLVTRGTTAPPPPQDEGGEAWNPSASNEAPSSSQPSATAVERIASLATMLGRSNEYFAVRVGGVVVSSTAAAAPPGDNSVSPFPEERPLDEQQQRHPGPRPPCALAVLTRDVLQNVSTRNAVQQLLNRYQCTNKPHRRPTRVEDTETDALVRVLPEDAQRSAKSTLQYRDDPAVSPEGDLASEASPRMATSHAQLPVPTCPAASNEKAVALERWLDLTLARLTSETADLAPPPTPLPWVLRCPEQEEGLTWNALHTQLLSIIKNMHHDSKDGPHAAAQVSSSQHNLDTYTQRRATTLRSTLLRVLSRSSKQVKNPLTFPGIEKDVSVCVSSLLLLGYVLVPLQSLRPPPSMVEVSAVVRRELSRLVLPMVCNGASVSSACASSASRQRSRSFYSALVQFCVRPLVLDALPQPCLSTLATNQARTAAFEAAAYLVLLVHHMSTAIHGTRVFFFGTLTDTAASSASRNKLAGDATTVDALSNTARELHRLSERELYHLLQTSSASTLSLQEPLRMVYGLLVRAWMQAGVLLGDVRSLLWGGQRLATWSLQRRQEATALAWIAEGSAAVSGSTAQTRCAAEADALAEWLCVLPVAVLVAEVCGVTRGSHTGLSEALYSLAAVLPLPSSFSSAPAPSSHGASVAVARDGYVNLLLHWRQQLQQQQQQNRETGTSSGHLGGLPQKRLSSPSPFAVILHGSVPANTTHALIDSVRRRVREYLAGSTISYPLEQQQQITPLSCNITPSLRCGGEGGCIGSRGIITAAALSEAFQCVRNASEADMRAFMRLEAAKRTPASKDVRRGAPKKAMVIQAMWSLINRAALQRRQGCGAGSSDTASWVPFVPPETWQSYVLNLHPVVPHTVHFIPAAVTEVLMLESCITWTDGLAVLEHSLGTLHHTGATPVQQYMAQLLLERVRRTQQSPERLKAVDEREEEHHFCAKLETYTYTALQQQQQPAGGDGAAFPHWHLWSQHMARRSTCSTAALVCRIVDLLLMHHVQTTRTTTRGSNTRLSSVLAKHTLMEALRCGVHDPALTRALFSIFWIEQYPRVEGVHVFLSALRAAKLARSDALALEAMLTYLWISDQNVDTTQRREEWTSHVLRAIDECETRATVAGPHISSSLSSSGASAWQHLKVAARKAAELQGPSHRFSVEAHRATWKSWTVLCRLRVVPKDVALCVVGLFKQLDRITEVEELMVTTCYVK